MGIIYMTQWCLVILLVLCNNECFVRFSAGQSTSASEFESCTLDLMHQSDFSFNGKINDVEFLILLDSLSPSTCDIVHAYENDVLLKKLWEIVTCLCPDDDPRAAMLSTISNNSDSGDSHFLQQEQQQQDDITDFTATPELDCCGNQLTIPFESEINSLDSQKYVRICYAIDIAVHRECLRINPALRPPTLSPALISIQNPTNNPIQTQNFPLTQARKKTLTHTPTSDLTLPPTQPLKSPTLSPTLAPTTSPTPAPTTSPTPAPTTSPTPPPTSAPTTSPTLTPTKSPSLAPTTAPTITLNVEPAFVQFKDFLNTTSTSQQLEDTTSNIFNRTEEEYSPSSSVGDNDTSSKSNVYRILFGVLSFITMMNGGCYLLFRNRQNKSSCKEEGEDKKKLNTSEKEVRTSITETALDDSFGRCDRKNYNQVDVENPDDNCPQTGDKNKANESFDWGGFADVEEANEDVEKVVNENDASESSGDDKKEIYWEGFKDENENNSDSNKKGDWKDFHAMKKKYELSSELFNMSYGSKRKKEKEGLKKKKEKDGSKKKKEKGKEREKDRDIDTKKSAEDGSIDCKNSKGLVKSFLNSHEEMKRKYEQSTQLFDKCWNGSQAVLGDNESDHQNNNAGYVGSKRNNKESQRQQVDKKQNGDKASPCLNKANVSNDDNCYDPDSSQKKIAYKNTDAGSKHQETNNRGVDNQEELKFNIHKIVASPPRWGKVSESTRHLVRNANNLGDAVKAASNGSTSIKGSPPRLKESLRQDINNTAMHTAAQKSEGSSADEGADFSDDDSYYASAQTSGGDNFDDSAGFSDDDSYYEPPNHQYKTKKKSDHRVGRPSSMQQIDFNRLRTERQASHRHMHMERQMERRITSRRGLQMERQPSRRNMQMERQPSRRSTQTERQPSRRNMQMERQPSRRNMQMERQPSRRNMQMEHQPSRRGRGDQPSRRGSFDDQPSHRDSFSDQPSHRDSFSDIETGNIPNTDHSRQRLTEENNRDRRSNNTPKRKKRFNNI